jgi:hypothetical protein
VDIFWLIIYFITIPASGDISYYFKYKVLIQILLNLIDILYKCLKHVLFNDFIDDILLLFKDNLHNL